MSFLHSIISQNHFRLNTNIISRQQGVFIMFTIPRCGTCLHRTIPHVWWPIFEQGTSQQSNRILLVWLLQSYFVIYLNEEDESDPLVVLGELLVFGQVFVALVDTRKGHIDSHLLEEGAGNRVGGVNPTKRVQHVVADVSVRNSALLFVKKEWLGWWSRNRTFKTNGVILYILNCFSIVDQHNTLLFIQSNE